MNLMVFLFMNKLKHDQERYRNVLENVKEFRAFEKRLTENQLENHSKSKMITFLI